MLRQSAMNLINFPIDTVSQETDMMFYLLLLLVLLPPPRGRPAWLLVAIQGRQQDQQFYEYFSFMEFFVKSASSRVRQSVRSV